MADINGSAEIRNEKALERLVLFTDAVIAIVITLMVLEVKPPHIEAEPQLLPALKHLWHEYLAVGISFFVIGILWSTHNRRFHWMKRSDGGLVMINMLFLLAVSAIPFVTAVLAKHPYRDATVIYAATVAISPLLLALLWLYARGKGLLAPEMPRSERWIGVASPLASAAVFLGSIPVAFWSPVAARMSWILVFIIAMGIRLAISRGNVSE